jgi:DNA-binding GntR family transcriptional regulator
MSFTRSDQIYQELKGDILSLKLAPGTELKLQELVDRLLVSKSPIRDALQQLKSEGLVDIWPQSGTRVSLIDLSQVEVERLLRTTLEQEAVRGFCKKPDERALAQMRFLIEEQRWTANQNAYLHFLQLDDAFHQQIFIGCGLGRFWDIIQNQMGNYQRIRILSFEEPEVIPAVVESHKKLLRALEEKDLDEALRLESGHVRKLDTELGPLMERYPGYFTNTKR